MNTKCEICGEYFSTSKYYDHLPHCVNEQENTKMKTYSGELKDGMPYLTNAGLIRRWNKKHTETYHIKEVYHDNEWQLYEPKPKKVWGIPEYGEEHHRVLRSYNGNYIVESHINLDNLNVTYYLCKDTAEQVAKAMNVMNEYRMISDVPVDGTHQWFINYKGDIDCWNPNNNKLRSALFGVVVNGDRQHELEKWCNDVRIANNILQFAWHGNGLVEERL